MAHVQVYRLHCDGSAIYIHQKEEAIGGLKQMVYSPRSPDVTSMKAAWELQTQKHLKACFHAFSCLEKKCGKLAEILGTTRQSDLLLKLHGRVLSHS